VSIRTICKTETKGDVKDSLCEVVLEHSHEDGGQEAREQEHRDAAVDDGEPVDVQVLRQERVARVLVHAPAEVRVARVPLDRKGEVNLDADQSRGQCLVSQRKIPGD
jgi:hypothetical protein